MKKFSVLKLAVFFAAVFAFQFFVSCSQSPDDGESKEDSFLAASLVPSFTERVNHSVPVRIKVEGSGVLQEVAFTQGRFDRSSEFFSLETRIGAKKDADGFFFEAEENGFYTVGVKDLHGNSATKFVSITNIDLTPPSAPKNVDAQFIEDRNEIRLSWTCPDDEDFSFVRICAFRSGEFFSETESNLCELVFEGIPGGESEYSFTVRSVDDLGNEGEALTVFCSTSKSPSLTSISIDRTHVGLNPDGRTIFVEMKTVRFSEEFSVLSGAEVVVLDGDDEVLSVPARYDSAAEILKAEFQAPIPAKPTVEGKKYKVRPRLFNEFSAGLEAVLNVSRSAETLGLSLEADGVDLDALSGKDFVSVGVSAANLDLAKSVSFRFVSGDGSFFGEELAVLPSGIFAEFFSEGRSFFEIQMEIPKEQGSYLLKSYVDGIEKASARFSVRGNAAIHSLEIPGCGLSASGRRVRAMVLGNNFCGAGFDPSSFQVECDSVLSAGLVEVASNSVLEIPLEVPSCEGDYTVRVNYGGVILEGRLSVRDYSDFVPGNVMVLDEDGKISCVAPESILDSLKDFSVAVCIGFGETGVPLGLGLYNSHSLGSRNGRVCWSAPESFGTETKFENLLCIPESLAEPGSFEGRLSGRNSLDFVRELDFLGTSESEIAEKYPVFNYALSYGEKTCVKDGWYAPSAWEIYMIYEKFSAVENALSACGGTPIAARSSAYYYTSSQSEVPGKVYKFNFKEGRFAAGNKQTSTECFALAVREFPVR